MYRLLFWTFVFGALCPVPSSTTIYEGEADLTEHLRQARNKLQSHFDEWLSRKLGARSEALRPDPQPAALPDWLSKQDALAATQSRSRDIDASQPNKRGLYASQARSAGAYPSQGIPSFKDLAKPHGHGFFHLFHLHPPNGDQESWNHNDDRDFSYLLDDKAGWEPCPQPPCLPPVNPVAAPPPPEYLPKPVYQYPSLPAYNPYQQDYEFYPDPTFSQQQPQPSYQYPPAYQSYNPHDRYPPLNHAQDPQPAAYPYQQYYPVYQYQATQPPVYQYPQYQYDQHRQGYPAPGPLNLKPVRIVNKPTSNIAQLPSVVPSTTNSTSTQLPYFATTMLTTEDLAASTIEETVPEGDLVALTVTPSVDSYDATADILEVTSSTPSASTSSLVDEMELVGSSSTVLPALLELRGVVTTLAPITEEEEFYHGTTAAHAEDDSPSEDYPVTPTLSYGTESIVPTTETADKYSTILPVEATSLDYTEKSTQSVSTGVLLLLPEGPAASTVSEAYSTTEIPDYTTTVEMSISSDDAVSLYVGTTEESTAGNGYTASTVEVTAKVPVYTTTVEQEATEETDLPYEGTIENSQQTTVSSEHVPSTVEATTDLPVYTTTVKIETEKTVSAYEETTEESHQTTLDIENTYSTVQETTEVPVYTPTVKMVTKTDSPYEETNKTTVGIENTYSTIAETTDVPFYTTTVKIATEEALSPHEETPEENYKTTAGIENTYSTVEETTAVPVYTTTVKMVTETHSPYEGATEDGSKATVGNANTPSAVDKTTEVPVYTTTMNMETDLPHEATTKGSQETTISGEYTLPTIEGTTEVSIYTTTVKIGTEETISPYARSTEIGEQRSAEVSNTGLIPLPKRNYRKGIVRREDALAKRREELRRTSSGSDLNMVSSEEETGRGHTPPKPETGFEKRFLRKLINMIVRELRQDAVSKEEKARLKEAFGDMWYSIVNEAFKFEPAQLPDDDVPKIASRVLEYLLKGTPLARRLETQSVKGRSIRSRRDTRRPRLEPWQEMLLRAVMARPLTPPDEQRSQEILNAIKDQLEAPEDDLEYADEEIDDDIRR